MSHLDYCRGSDLCNEIAGRRDVSFNRVYEGEPASRVIAADEVLLLLADMSPLVAGHLLLVPKQHYYSFAQVLADHQSHVNRFLRQFCPLYEDTFGAPSILEHGSSEEVDHSACITHAHWHIIPTYGALIKAQLSDDGLRPLALPDLDSLAHSRWCNTPYFFHSFGGCHYVYQNRPDLPRQYLRSVVGRILSIPDPEWDYALIVRKHLLRDTMQLVKHWNL